MSEIELIVISAGIAFSFTGIAGSLFRHLASVADPLISCQSNATTLTHTDWCNNLPVFIDPGVNVL
jgi:hypothetical protein